MGTPRGPAPSTGGARAAVVSVVVGALLAGCQWSASEGVPVPSTAPEPEADSRLAAFYQQPVKWAPCDKFECAKLTVPVDYAKPEDGRTFTLPLIKAVATKPEQRIGVLIAGAGGPGQSGVSMVKDLAESWPAAVRERFDVVSFDPRGVGGSEPRLKCETQGEPPAEKHPDLPLIGDMVAGSKQYAEACLKHTDAGILGHVGTADVIQDLDVLRVVTGQEKLTYVGYSYGTRIGQLYADRFPKKIRAMVLDGVDNMSLDWRDDPIQQAESIEQALHAYARDCAARTRKPCPGRTEAEIIATVNRVIDKGDKSGEGDIRGDISAKLTFPEEWSELSEILIDADRPKDTSTQDGGTAEDTAAQPEEPASDDTAEALTVVNCLDRPHPTDLAAYEEAAQRIRDVSRLADGSELLSCAFLPPATSKPKVVRAAGAPTILLVATTVDAATPYRWAQALAASMPSAALLTNEDVGHSVYGGTSSCVDDVVNRYLIDLTPPPAHARCATRTGG
ncbi:alpha/beta hydrolase fold [Actinokineospora alba]|uniref:Alpha/beta hydrolase fold n=1 Tax=Actinokineospora alba TaxID=504798 RepID=A0A1H0VH40_9PSEU|nr:alpha/beta hydrolase [Actinokineospora alba]TDP67739.1 alpha/beta hydrolase family protein [Actinokineospora alba]SDJ27009.1 alpha/beta hydrolase fold [Actinokineospora alba]SDP77664.1 alpha/beta hydrolase fold [Actinokineospora alba]